MKWIKLFESYNQQDKIKKANEMFCYFGLKRTLTKNLTELTWVEPKQVYIGPYSKTKVMFKDKKNQSMYISPNYVLKIIMNFRHQYVNTLQEWTNIGKVVTINTNFVVTILLKVLEDFFELKIAIDTK